MENSRKAGTGLYSLNWNNYNNHLSRGIKNLLVDDKLTDVTLSCEGNCIRSHKLLLSLCSPYFKKLFEMPQHQKENTIVILSNVRFKDLKNIVTFIYTGEVKMQQSDLKIFLQTCKQLRLNIMASDTPSTPPKPATSTPVMKPKPPMAKAPELRNAVVGTPNSDTFPVDPASLCQTEMEGDMLEILDDEDGESQYAENSFVANGIEKQNGNAASNEKLNATGEGDSNIRIDDIKTDDSCLYDIEDVGYEENESGMNDADGTDADQTGYEGYEDGNEQDESGNVDMMGESYGEQYDDEDVYTQPLYQFQQTMVQADVKPRSSKVSLTPHICHCGAQFYRKDSYRRHKKCHGAPQYKCPYCKKGFYRRDLYNRHLDAQHGIKPSKGN